MDFYSVKLGISGEGISEETAPDLLEGFEEELAMRPHVRSAELRWDADQEMIIVTVGVEDTSQKGANIQMQEEFLEMVPAVIPGTGGIEVKMVGDAQ